MIYKKTKFPNKINVNKEERKGLVKIKTGQICENLTHLPRKKKKPCHGYPRCQQYFKNIEC